MSSGLGGSDQRPNGALTPSPRLGPEATGFSRSASGCPANSLSRVTIAPIVYLLASERSESLGRKDRRRYPRTTVDLPVECTLGNQRLRPRASILSGGGVLLGLTESLAPDTEVGIRFRPAKHLPLIEATGRVRYQTTGGTAIEFTDISSANRQLLLRLLHHKSADKRRHPRAPLATQIQSEQRMSLAFSRDISVSGMFIETRKPLPVETRLNLRFNLEDGRPAVLALVQVTYEVERLGMGVHFVSVSPTDRKRIATYVAKSPAVRRASKLAN